MDFAQVESKVKVILYESNYGSPPFYQKNSYRRRRGFCRPLPRSFPEGSYPHMSSTISFSVVQIGCGGRGATHLEQVVAGSGLNI